jgi:lipopolysaccharide transport system permease protein
VNSSSPTGAFVPGGRRLRIDSRNRWFPDLRAFFRARQLLALLNRRDITVRYRQTVLGTIWIVASPLLSAGLFTFVFGRVAKLPSDGIPYFAFSYAGLTGWNLFSDTMQSAAKSLTSNSGLVTKIYFPRLVVPLSTTASALINTAISLAVMCVLLVSYGLGFSWHLIVLPLWFLLAIVLGLGIGLVLTSVAVTYRDVNYITPALMPLILYLTPVAYSINAVPADLRHIYRLNPISTIVEGCRWSLLGHGDLSGAVIASTVALAIVILTVGMVVFARLEGSFADVI